MNQENSKEMKRIIAITVVALMTSHCLNAQTTDTTSTANALDSIVTCAKAGNDTCQNLLGKWIFEGSHGYQQDYAKAAAWWMQAAKQNNNDAVSNLGFCYLYGWGVDKDTTTATRLFEKALKQDNRKLVPLHDSLATKGSVYSAMFLARCYKMAIGVRRDMQQSLKYYKIAAKLGNVEAMREAAIMMRGNKDDAAALSMFKQAMQKGDVTSTYYYGKMLCEGRGIGKDARAGVAYIHQAADKGYAAAQYELANAYAKGIGIEMDAAKAYHWYSQAAAGGNWAAWWEKAERLRKGSGVTMNYEAALECYAKACDLGYHNKLKALLSGENPEWKDTPFMHYLRGMQLLEIDQNPDAAKGEFSKLPKTITLRQTMEAVCMVHPACKKPNVKKAVKGLQKLATVEPRAAYEMAMLQLQGTGVDKDIAKAEKSLTELANSGYVRATNFLADGYYDGQILPQNKGKAILLYLRAEKQQSLTAVGATRLAQAFRNGDGMKVDENRAAELEKYKAPDVKKLLEMVVR